MNYVEERIEYVNQFLSSPSDELCSKAYKATFKQDEVLKIMSSNIKKWATIHPDCRTVEELNRRADENIRRDYPNIHKLIHERYPKDAATIYNYYICIDILNYELIMVWGTSYGDCCATAIGEIKDKLDYYEKQSYLLSVHPLVAFILNAMSELLYLSEGQRDELLRNSNAYRKKYCDRNGRFFQYFTDKYKELLRHTELPNYAKLKAEYEHYSIIPKIYEEGLKGTGAYIDFVRNNLSTYSLRFKSSRYPELFRAMWYSAYHSLEKNIEILNRALKDDVFFREDGDGVYVNYFLLIFKGEALQFSPFCTDYTEYYPVLCDLKFFLIKLQERKELALNNISNIYSRRDYEEGLERVERAAMDLVAVYFWTKDGTILNT